jgi:copper chaperone CopZ
MKYIIIFIFIVLSISSKGQAPLKISLQASGLTCSMCNNSINKALYALSFIDHVESEIKDSYFHISLKKNQPYSFDEIKTAVEDAGFFVAKFYVYYEVNNLVVESDTHTIVDNNLMHFLHTKNSTLNGETKFQILNKGFVTDKEFKSNRKYTKMACYDTGITKSCCSKEPGMEGKRIFNVTVSQ